MNPVKVFPVPVGDATSTSEPVRTSGQALACGSVGPRGKRQRNHAANAGWKLSTLPPGVEVVVFSGGGEPSADYRDFSGTADLIAAGRAEVAAVLDRRAGSAAHDTFSARRASRRARPSQPAGGMSAT